MSNVGSVARIQQHIGIEGGCCCTYNTNESKGVIGTGKEGLIHHKSRSPLVHCNGVRKGTGKKCRWYIAHRTGGRARCLLPNQAAQVEYNGLCSRLEGPHKGRDSCLRCRTRPPSGGPCSTHPQTVPSNTSIGLRRDCRWRGRPYLSEQGQVQ